MRIGEYLSKLRNGNDLASHASSAGSLGQSNSESPSTQEPKKLQVVVFRQGQKNIGLVVHRILDIVEENVVLEHPSHDEGIRGSAVVQNKVTDLLDVEDLLQERPSEEEFAGAGVHS